MKKYTKLKTIFNLTAVALLFIGYSTTSFAGNGQSCWCNDSGQSGVAGWDGSAAQCCSTSGTNCVLGSTNFSGCSGETEKGYYCPNSDNYYTKCLA